MATKKDSIVVQLKTDGAGRLKASIAGIASEVDGLDSAIKKTSPSLLNFKNIISTVAIGALISSLVKNADAYNVLQQRIKTATKETGDYVRVSNELFNISVKNGVELNSTVGLFQNLARSSPELQATTDDMLKLTDAVQQLGVISGASQNNLSAGLLQFSQGLSSGVFRAEEFNSLLENIPEVAVRIAKGMGLTTGELRKQIINGEILSKDVFDSLLKQAPEISAEFKDIPLTVGRAAENLNTSFASFLGKLDRATGLTTTIANTMKGIADLMSGSSKPVSDLTAELKSLEKQLESIGEKSSKRKRNKGKTKKYIEDQIAEIRTQINDNLIADGGAVGLRIAIDRYDQQITAAQDQLAAADAKLTGNARRKLNEMRDNINQLKKEREAAQNALAESELSFSATAGTGSNTSANNKKKTKEQTKAYNEMQKAAAQVYAETRTEQENLATKLATLDQLLESGKISWDTYSRAVFNANEEAENAGDKLSNLEDDGVQSFDRLVAAAKGWGQQFTNTLADMVQNGKIEFSSLADSIISDLLRIQIYQNVTTPLFAAMDIPGFTNNGGAKKTAPVSKPSISGVKKPVYSTNSKTTSGQPSASVEIINNGTPMQVKSANTQFDGQKMITQVFIDDWQRGGPIRRTIKGG